MTRAITMSAWLNTPIKTGNAPIFYTPRRFGIPVILPLRFLLMAWLGIMALTACAPSADDTLRIGLASAPVTLDPRFATDATSSRINRLLYTRLVAFNELQLPVPGIAHWQRVSPTHYRFTLNTVETSTERDFHDGSLLTAKDVKATYESVLNPENASPHRATLSVIERIETPDKNTIDFYLKKADLLFPGYLVIGILPASKIAEGHPFNQHPVGSGPFNVIAWPEDGRLQLLRRRDQQRISFIRVSDATVRVLKLLRGEVDMLQNDLSPELVTYLEQKSDITVTRAKGSNFTYLGFNLDDDIVGMADVRRAIGMAIDRQAIIHYVMGGSARPASAMLPPNHWAGNPALVGLTFNPQGARELLAKHGYGPQNPLKITYKTSTNAFRVRLATVLQSQLKDVGIDVDLRSYDWGTFYGDIKAGNFQVFSLSWVGIKTPDIFRYVFHSESIPPNGANRGRYQNKEADRLINLAGNAETLEAQASAYRKLQQQLLDTLPYVPLWYEDHVFIAKKGIKGYTLGLDGNYDGLITVQMSR